MPTNTDEAVAAFRAADPVAADAYADTASGPDATATLHRIMATPATKARRPWRRPITLGAAVTAAAGVAVMAIAVVTTGGTSTVPPRMTTAAYSVTSNADGSVTVTVRNWRGNLADLAEELQKRDVPALPPPNPPDKYNCHYRTTGTGGADLDKAQDSIVDSSKNTFTVRPDLIPDGVYMVIGEHNDPASTGFGVEWMQSSTRPTITCS